MSSKRTIPATIADITPEWMTGVLRDAGFPAVTVQSMSQSDGEGESRESRVSDSGVLSLTYSEAGPDAPDSVFVKVVTTSAGAGASLDEFGLYEAEADFYNGPGRNPGIRVPRAYFAAYQPEPLRYVSVIGEHHGRHWSPVSRRCPPLRPDGGRANHGSASRILVGE